MNTKLKLRRIEQKIAKLNEEAREIAEGKTIKIVSDYNGQPCGRSKKSLKEKTFKIWKVIINGSDIYFWIKEHRRSLSLNDVNFLN